MSIWDDEEMYKKLWPVIVKSVINELTEVSELAAEQFLRLFQEKIVGVQNRYKELISEKELLEKGEDHRLDISLEKEPS